MRWWILFVGGGLGAMMRFALALWVDARAPVPFPWGTWVVNVSGCFAIGLVATLADEHRLLSPSLRLFLVAGLLGGFTTFSTFGLETLSLLRDQRLLSALGYVGGNVLAGFGAVWLGHSLTRIL